MTRNTNIVSVDTPRGTFRIHRTGEGARNVLCLHPLASSGAFWDRVAATVGEAVTVFAPDARGHGASEWDGSTFTVQDMADDVAAIVNAVVDGPVGVVGKSMGGCVAQALAVRHPDLVDCLVLADTTSCYGPDRVEKWAQRANNAKTIPRSEQVEFQLERWFSDQFKAEHPEETQRIVDIFLSTDSVAHAAACTALGAFDGTNDLSRIRVPTLVIVGEYDQATPIEMAQGLAEGIPDAQLEVVRGAKHLSLLENSDVWPHIMQHLSHQWSDKQ